MTSSFSAQYVVPTRWWERLLLGWFFDVLRRETVFLVKNSKYFPSVSIDYNVLYNYNVQCHCSECTCF